MFFTNTLLQKSIFDEVCRSWYRNVIRYKWVGGVRLRQQLNASRFAELLQNKTLTRPTFGKIWNMVMPVLQNTRFDV